MLRKLLGVTLVVSWICAAAGAHAEKTYPGQWWRLPNVSQQLALTDQQKQRLDVLFNTNRSKLIALRNTVRQQRLELEKAMEGEPLDVKQAKEHFEKLEAARSDLASERFQYIVQVRQILGAKAFQQLKAFFHHWHRH